MEFIGAEEFLRQPKEVQEVFLDWWEPSIGDIFTWANVESNNMRVLECCNSELQTKMTNRNKGLHSRIPLLTEGQLRKFIEDKTKYHLELSTDLDSEFYIADFYKNNKSKRAGRKQIITKQIDLFKAYWKVACEIAKESVENE